MAHGLSCSTACGIFPDQGSNTGRQALNHCATREARFMGFGRETPEPSFGLMADSRAGLGRIQDGPGISCSARKCSKNKRMGMSVGHKRNGRSSHGQSWNSLSNRITSVSVCCVPARAVLADAVSGAAWRRTQQQGWREAEG